MNNTCSCICNGCHSRTQIIVRYSFPKKLLVATVVVVLAMCLVTADARSIEHKIRHGRRHDLQPTKDKLRMPEKRQTQLGPMTTAKEIADEYRTQTRKIIWKLKNTRRFLNDERKIMKEMKEYRDGMLDWVPSTNFVTIHFHSFHRNGTSVDRWNRASMAERKFLYLMPKLYKSLQTFHNIFKRLVNLKVDAADEAYANYSKDRQKILTRTIGHLYSTVAAVKDSLISFNVSIPKVDDRHLDTMSKEVDAIQSLKYDYIAFRAYSNLLNNWYAEFRCPKGKKVTKSNKMCAAYEEKLYMKKNHRRMKSGTR